MKQAEEEQKNIEALFKQASVEAMKVTKGSLNLLFAAVGHGDCTVMRTPAGIVFVIDCGSSGGIVRTDNQERWEIVRDRIKLVLGEEKFIHFLILTHPDQDHFNLLQRALPADVTIERIYHSSWFGSYTTAGNQGGENVSAWLWGRVSGSQAGNQIQRVYLRYASVITGKEEIDKDNIFVARIQKCSEEKLVEIKKYPEESTDPLNCLDKNTGFLIWEEANCRVSILLSNVNQEHMLDASTAENRGSVVVLITAFNKKILICGDGTFNTEQELMTRYPALFRDQPVDILRVGHHGSRITSSQKTFIEYVKARNAWISEMTKSKYRSPAFSVIKDLWVHATTDERPHDLFFWTGENDSNFTGHQLRDCGRFREEISGIKFTDENIAKEYSRKGVFLTAMTPDRDKLIVISAPTS